MWEEVLDAKFANSAGHRRVVTWQHCPIHIIVQLPHSTCNHRVRAVVAAVKDVGLKGSVLNFRNVVQHRGNGIS